MVCVKLIRNTPINILRIILKYKNEIDRFTKYNDYIDCLKNIEIIRTPYLINNEKITKYIYKNKFCRKYKNCTCNKRFKCGFNFNSQDGYKNNYCYIMVINICLLCNHFINMYYDNYNYKTSCSCH